MKIKVKVKPKSPSSKLEKISDNNYLAHLKSKPEKGKANLELIKLLAKELSAPQNKIKILTPASRNKIVEISK